jgi:hypothetical protein
VIRILKTGAEGEAFTENKEFAERCERLYSASPHTSPSRIMCGLAYACLPKVEPGIWAGEARACIAYNLVTY